MRVHERAAYLADKFAVGLYDMAGRGGPSAKRAREAAQAAASAGMVSGRSSGAFLSRHRVPIAGGGIAVGGGAFLVKHHRNQGYDDDSGGY